MERIPISGPWITEKEADYVLDAVRTGWYGRANEYNSRFEDAFCRFVGVKHSISLPSCTSAIHLALAAMGVGPGDEVIVPELTWIASAAPISYLGATPVFADVEKDTWCLSPESVKASITSRTKALIPVDLYGNMPRLDVLSQVAEPHGIKIIEDAAEAIGSTYLGKQAGSFGNFGVFSFHGSKTLTTGEGGMLVTDDKALYDRCLFLRDHGRVPGDLSFRNREVAYKYKMSGLQAALGLAQLERVQALVQKKREIFGWYEARLGQYPHLSLNPSPGAGKNSYWMSTVIWDSSIDIDKWRVMDELDRRGIDVRPFFSPLSSLPAYQDKVNAMEKAELNKVAYAISLRGINLPSPLILQEEQAERVCNEFLTIVGLK